MHGYAMPAATSNKTDWRQLAILIFLAVVIALLWNTFVVYPLRVLVVVFHEFSHGAAALLTGGEIVEIQINHREGGHCITRGGSPFIIVSAGYIGSLLCGAAILYATSRTRSAHVLSGILGAILLLATLIWVRPFIGFGFGFGFAFATVAAIALILTSIYFPHGPNDIVLKVIGLTSCLYAPLDIKSDVFDAGHAASDATILAHQTGVPAVVWGTLWLIISLIIGFYALRAACRGNSRIRTYTP